jgi:hypothetical protein
MLYPLSYRRPSHTRVNDWSRIADPRGVDEISAPLDLRPGDGERRVCSADGQHGYRVLGEPSDATIAEVSTAPSEDHLSWTAEIRFQASSRTAVTAARDTAAGVGGMVLVTVDDAVLIAVRPDEITPTTVRFFGLEKPEGWAIPELFPGV